jgi:hypothetical protein
MSDALTRAKRLIQAQVPGSRFTEKYQIARHYGRTGSGYPSLPSRAPTSPKAPKSPTSPTLASRKVVTEFASFGAPKNASVFRTAVQSTPFSLAGGSAAFGAVRSNKPRGMMDDDDDEDEDNNRGPQRVELREDSITLDQVGQAISSWMLLLTK